ncbi:MAG: hypothetical protein L3J03_01380 [Desulfobacterales bacterium]|nr:hypothetical protein [Desulfobacterales bacterium]
MRLRFPATTAMLFGALLLLPALIHSVAVAARETPAAAVPESVEERRLLYDMGREQARLQAEYQQRLQQLDLREIELKTLAGEVEKKLNELKKLRESVQQLLAVKNAVEARRIKGLSKMYAKMAPAQAANLLTGLEQDLAVAILAGMAPKSGAKILDSMPVKIATTLSVAYSSLEKQ